MPIGARLLWAARPRNVHPLQGRCLLFSHQIQVRCWLSPKPDDGLAALEDAETSYKNIAASSTGDIEPSNVSEQPPSRKTSGSRQAPGEKKGNPWRHALQTAMRAHRVGPHAKALIEPLIKHKDPELARRSLRKHELSARRQVVHDYMREQLDKPVVGWRTTLDFMLRHTPKFDHALEFKVRIGSSAVAQPGTSPSDREDKIRAMCLLGRQHHCRVTVDEWPRDDGPLVLALSGTAVSVRESLLDIIGAVGRVAAVRVLDPDLRSSLHTARRQPPIRLLFDGEAAPEKETVTVYSHAADLAGVDRPPLRPAIGQHPLTTRADQIPRPAVWTTTSFEEYVAELVLARVPTHLHRHLYPSGSPDHQTTVVHIVTSLFKTEELHPIVSIRALKMALRFMLERGPMFRSNALALAHLAETHHLPLDAEVFRLFLVSASRVGDLQTFTSVLRSMVRRGYYVGAETWATFLVMIKGPEAKYQIMDRMRSRGLHRIQLILDELGRQTAVLDIQTGKVKGTDVERLIQAHDKTYGASWLEISTFNKMLGAYGSRGNLEACHNLLKLADDSRRVRPDHYTLNIMITHSPSTPEKIAMLSRWPRLSPDALTYQMLFSEAWKHRFPNMLRMLWRYSAFCGMTNARMRRSLTTLMGTEFRGIESRVFLKPWEDVIMGRDELAAVRQLVADGSPGTGRPGAIQLAEKYVKDAGDLRPAVKLGTKLQEAYEMDVKIHGMLDKGVEFSAAMREQHMVDIPLVAPKVLQGVVRFYSVAEGAE
ncbi:hypothetical protein F4777DRAFT_81637 [Nemania sp. FL0916]|nr:hypothetical protein F4777DRAFT_81637 [Nemania sp. FL0916]